MFNEARLFYVINEHMAVALMQVRIQDSVKGGPASEAESCWYSEVGRTSEVNNLQWGPGELSRPWKLLGF